MQGKDFNFSYTVSFVVCLDLREHRDTRGVLREGAVSRANVEYKWVLEAVLPYHFVALNINFCSSRVLVFEQLAALDLMRADIGRQMRRLERDALEMGCSLRLCGLLKTIA